MYRLQIELEKLEKTRIDEESLLDGRIAEQLIGLACRYTTTVTLYNNRSGLCVQVCQGDETVALRHLRHKGSNRLSGIRALRVLAPHALAPRGRDRLELADNCLDLMVVLTSEGVGVLVEPVIKDGRPAKESTVSEIMSADAMAKLSLPAIIARVEAQLGRHERIHSGASGRKTALLIGVDFSGENYKSMGGARLDELTRLVKTADLQPVRKLIQKRRAPRPGTFIGKGKVEEIRDIVLDEGIEMVVFGCDLPYSTIHRLTERMGVPVFDRSELILEIFALHATTNEGRLQVKLAQLDHSLHRLLKEEKDMDRQAAGIGVRGGPGETGATLIRRRIHRKKVKIEKKLAVMSQQRREGRQRRAACHVARVAMAGYTNAGKSTLLNALCCSEEAETADQMFTTLTTTTRRVCLPSRRPMLLSDTVGFVEQLPHHLVAAFESTLLESAQADLTLVVVESNVETLQRHKSTVDGVLDRLGQPGSRRLPVLTKMDLLSEVERKELRKSFPGAIEISAFTGEGMTELAEVIDALLSREERELELLLPFAKMGLVDQLFSHGQILRQEWTDKGFRIRARFAKQNVKEVREFIVS